jgi:serine/threonine-protein kinase
MISEKSLMAAGPDSRARYQVVTQLGQGGMARVLLTVTRGPAGVNKLLVVKELRDELKNDPEFVTMFLDEARIAARLNHPNVIQTYEVGSDGEHPIIVMEYLEGQSLSSVLGRVGRKVLPLELHVHVLAQIATALNYAHDLKDFEGRTLGLVHRDVSPHNVFVTYDGQIKLVDFGIAKAADSAGLTRAGTFKGKVGYASPEQLLGEAVDRRSDIFSLGVMLWEAIAQRRMTFGEPEAAVMRRRADGGDPRIKDVVPDAPDELCRICEKAKAHEPADRYATAAELRAALDGWLSRWSRSATSEDIGELVRTTFAADREKIRSLVEARLKAIASGEAVSLSSADLAPLSRSGSGSGSIDPINATLRAAAAAREAGEAPQEQKRTRMLLGIGIAAAAVAVGFQLTRSTSGAAEPSASATASASAAPASATVEVAITVDPPEARAFLDDTALGSNPFRGTMPRSTLTRRLRMSAPGFATDERLVVLDRDLRLELSLKPTAAGPAGSSTPAAAALTGRLPAGAAPSSASPRSSASSAPTAAPGETLNNPTRKKARAIDDTF